MSTPYLIRERLLESFRTNPHPLFAAIASVHDWIPAIDPGLIRPREFDTGVDRAPTLAWGVDRLAGSRRGIAVIVDVALELDPERVWLWPIWRTAARAEFGCPTWVVVCVPDPAVLDTIRRAFDHEQAALPLLIDADAKLLAKPRPYAPRPRFDLHL